MTRSGNAPPSGTASSFGEMHQGRDDPSTAEREGARATILAGLFPERAGQRVDGRYELRGVIGAGGLGRVHRAHDHKLQREVALKVLRGGRLSTALEREARVLAQLQHPNIVAVYDVGSWNDRLYLTMELIDGQTLSDWLASGPRSLARVVEVFGEAGRGLAAAHAKGVVHRDFKPANVMLSDDGRVRVVDFGLAREAERTEGGSEDGSGSGSRTSAAGTRPYMAPEQFDGVVVAASDQFAFCTSLFEALCGHRPWSSPRRGISDETDAARISAPLRAAKVPRWLCRMIVRGLRLRPADRFADFDALLRGLTPPRRGRAWAAGSSVAGLAVVGLLALPTTPLPRDGCEGRGTMVGSVYGARTKARILEVTRDAGDEAQGMAATRILDDYVDAWRAMDLAVCRVETSRTPEAAVATLQARCLQQSLDQVAFLVDRLTAGDTELARAEQAAKATTNLAACEDTEHLLLTQPEPGHDAATDQRVNAGIDRAHVLLALGDQQGHDEILEHLVDDPGLAHAPKTRLWLAAQWAHTLLTRGEPEAAEAVAREAVEESARHPQWARHTGVLLSVLAQTLVDGPGHAAEARSLARLGLSVLDGVPGTDHFKVVHENVLARVALREGDVLAAEQALQRAAQISERGRLDAAYDWFDRPINTAQNLGTQAELAYARGRFDDAIALNEAALAVFDSEAGDTVLEAKLLNNLAAAQRSAKQPALALATVHRAIEIKRKLGLLEGAASSLTTLGNAYGAAGEPEEAMAAFGEALSLLTRPSVARAKAYYNRGLAHLAAGELTRARDDLEASAADARTEVAADEALHFSLHIARAQVHIALGDLERARQVLEIAAYVEPSAPEASLRAELYTARAQAWATVDAAFAKEQARAAIAAADEAGQPGLVPAEVRLQANGAQPRNGFGVERSTGEQRPIGPELDAEVRG